MAFDSTVLFTALPGGEWVRQSDRWAFTGLSDLQIIDSVEDEPGRCVFVNLAAGGPPSGEFMTPFSIPTVPTSPATLPDFETFCHQRPGEHDDKGGTSDLPSGKRPKLSDPSEKAIEQMEEQLRQALDGVDGDIPTFPHPIDALDASPADDDDEDMASS